MISATDLKSITKDDLLGLLGLETKRPQRDDLLIALGTFAAGLAVGAGVALLLAPMTGKELRAELKSRLPDFLPAAPPIEPVADGNS